MNAQPFYFILKNKISLKVSFQLVILIQMIIQNVQAVQPCNNSVHHAYFNL